MKKEEKHSNKCPICGRTTHKESKYCIFHASAEEKTEDEFKEALKEYIQKIKKEDGDYDFKEFIFIGDIYFKKDLNITVLKNADFRMATFKGNAGFRKANFEGYAGFVGANFEGYAGFVGANFKGGASFEGATFEGDSGFLGATFKGGASFLGATFEGDSGFLGATFKGGAGFRNAIFKGDAFFIWATFKGDADFEEATFKGDAGFKLEYLDKVIKFKKIRVFFGKKFFIKITNVGKKISFNRAYLENTSLDIELVEGVFIDFTGALLRNTKLEKDQIKNHIIQENEKKFTEAKEIFLLLKNNFHSIGRYEDESWAFKNEKEMERKSLSFPYHKKTLKEEKKNEKLPFLKWIKNGDFIKWIISGFSNIIYGYGEKPWNVIRAAAVIIVLFAFSFSLIGIANPEIIELNGTAIQQNSGNIVDLTSKGLLKNNVIRNFPDSLYFSTITFTTLGYGDFRPLEGLGRILAGSEAFIGAFMMALFVYTFARRTGGR